MGTSAIDYMFIFVPILMQSPILIAQLVGIGLAIARWKRHPRASLLVVIALSLFILQGVVLTSVSASLPMWFSTYQLSSIYMGLNVTNTCLSTIAWGVLIAALFLSRPPHDPDEDGMNDDY